MARTRARPRPGLRDLGQRARPPVQAVGVHRVGAEVHGEDVPAVRCRDDLVRVRTLLPRSGCRTAVGDQGGALAERARGVDRVHGDRARAVVGAQQPAPARMHRQVAGVRPARRAAAQHLAVRRAHGGHGPALALLDGVQRPAVGVHREIRRVRDAGDRAGARDPAGHGVVRGDADALAAVLHRGVGAEVQRPGTGRLLRGRGGGGGGDRGGGGGPGGGAARRPAVRCRGRPGAAVPAARQDRGPGRRAERPDETPPAPAAAVFRFRPTAHVPHLGSSSVTVRQPP
ncbi:hypothetical protein RKD18_006978 [Streptomyces phaeoluteigriseus]